MEFSNHRGSAARNKINKLPIEQFTGRKILIETQIKKKPVLLKKVSFNIKEIQN